MLQVKGWRTAAINVLVFLSALFGWEHLQQYIDPRHLVEGQAAVNLILRWFTTSPMGKVS